MTTTRGRLVKINQPVIDQAVFFAPDGFTRVLGLTISDITGEVYLNNVLQPWPLADGSSLTDGMVAVGRLYFHEIPSAGGNYSVRFRPNAVGYWRILVSYPAGTQVLAQDYDVISEPLGATGGLKTSFVKC